MSAATKTVGVYVCSNFGEMQAEREHLVQVVFPELRKVLERHRVQLLDLDPCWNESEELSTDIRFLHHCLQQIDQSRPLFIGLVGERYGRGPAKVPAEILKRHEWLKEHAGKSLLELQILHGALNPEEGQARSLLCFRDPAALEGVPEGIRNEHYVEPDADNQARLADLKERIRNGATLVLEPYHAEWAPDAYDRSRRANGAFANLEEFGKKVRDWLLEEIRRELFLTEDPPEETEAERLSGERHYQVRFIDPRARSFTGRTDLLKRLVAFLDGDDRNLCLLKGPNGMGKSSALGGLLVAYRKRCPEAWLIPHFIGPTPESRSLCGTLQSLCYSLKALLRLKDGVPQDTRQLTGTLRSWLRKVPEDRKVVIVVDALERLDGAYRAHELRWLPRKLPPNVKFVFSLTTGEPECETVGEALQARGYQMLEMKGLSAEERLAALKKHLAGSVRLLTTPQAQALLRNPATENPLYLVSALRELLLRDAGPSLEERIEALPTGPNALTALFDQIAERLMEEYEPTLIQTVLLGLAHSRHGLREEDLLKLAKVAKGADRLQPLLRDLRPYLQHRGTEVDSLCRSLFDAAKARFAATGRVRTEWFLKLSEYFDELGYGSRTGLENLPWLLVKGQDQEGLERVLCDLKFLQAKCRAGMLPDLLADYDRALAWWPNYQPYDPFKLVGTQVGRALSLESFGARAAESEAGLAETLGSVVELLLGLPDEQREIEADAPAYDSENVVPGRCFGPDRGTSEALKQMYRLQRASAEEQDLQPREAGAPRVQAFANFVSDCREELAKYPGEAGILARNRGAGCPVSKQGEALTGGLAVKWVSRDPRPPSPALRPLCVRVLEEHTAAVNSMALSPDGSLAVSGSSDVVLHVWDLSAGISLFKIEGHLGEITDVALAAEAGLAFSAAADRTLRVWDVESGRHVKTIEDPSEQMLGLAVALDGKRAVTFAEDHCLKVWDVDSGEVQEKIGVLENPITAVALTADGKMVIAGEEDGGISVWEADSGKMLLRLRKHEAPITSLHVTPEGKLLIAACQDGSLSVWDLTRRSLLQMLHGHSDAVHCVTATPDGRIALSGSADGTVCVWDVASGRAAQVIRGHADAVNAVGITPDARIAVSGSADDSLRVWDLSEGQAFEGPSDAWSSTPNAVAPDEKTVVSASDDCTLRFWDTGSGQTIRLLFGHTEPIRSVIFAPDGRAALSAGWDSTVRVWDLVAGESHLTLKGHTGSVNSIEVTPDGKAVVSASSDGTIRIWDLRTGAALGVLEGHHGSIHKVALAPDGRTAVSASDDYLVKIWDLAAGKLIRTIEGHAFPVRGASITPDGRTVVTASWDRTVRVWDLATGEQLATYLPQTLMEAVSQITYDGAFAAGTMDGHMHFLQLQNLEQEMPIITPIVAFEFDVKSFGKQMALALKRVLRSDKAQDDRQTPAFREGQKISGRFAKTPVMNCPVCGEPSPVPDEPRKVIQQNLKGLRDKKQGGLTPSPCLALPSEAFKDARLKILCPVCRKPVKLNPFFADSRE